MTRLSMVQFCSLVLSTAALLAFPSDSAHAQAGIYAMGSGGNYAGAGTAWGGTFGVYDNFIPLGPVKLGGDGRFLVQHNGGSTAGRLLGGFFGLRLTVGAPAVPVHPYIQAEVGGVGSNGSSSSSFAYQVQGGLDVTIFPHLDARGEFGGGDTTGNGSQSLEEFGLGLVLRL
jgi:hypothetical protein